MPNIQKLIAAPGPHFILPMAGLFLLGLALNSNLLAFLGLLGASFFTYFFRDPERVIPEEPGSIVSPADGKVVLLDEVQEDKFLGKPAKRVGIFMNVFDVHVNRSPMAGTVVVSSHQAGRFKAAFREAADQNEQQAVLLEGEEGRRVLVVQIAGLLARRIISYVEPGQKLALGERLGMICFGSRVDLYLPPEAEVLVKVGDRVQAGTSILARWCREAA